MSHDSAVDSKELAGAPETDIEVTPAMIEAGADVLRENWIDLREPDGAHVYSRVVAEVYRGMHKSLCGLSRQ